MQKDYVPWVSSEPMNAGWQAQKGFIHFKFLEIVDFKWEMR